MAIEYAKHKTYELKCLVGNHQYIDENHPFESLVKRTVW